MSFEWLLPRAFDLSAAVAMVTVSRAVWKMTTTTTTSGVRMSFPRRTTSPTPFSPRQPSVRGDDAGGLLECRGGYPRPPVKYNRRRRCRRSPSRRMPSAPTRLHGRVYIYDDDQSISGAGPTVGIRTIFTYNFQSSFVRVMKYDSNNRMEKLSNIARQFLATRNTIDRFEMTSSPQWISQTASNRFCLDCLTEVWYYNIVCLHTNNNNYNNPT